MTKHFCDFCGKEVPGSFLPCDTLFKIDKELSVMIYIGMGFTMICESCAKRKIVEHFTDNPPKPKEETKIRPSSNIFFHKTASIDSGARIGSNTKIWHNTHVTSTAQIGDNCTIGQNCYIAGIVGNGCKIQNNVNIFKGVCLEDDVFCGPNMTTTNILTPRAFVNRNDEFKPTLIKKGASIGAGAIIVCGNIIGRYALVGAGSVVTKDVPEYALVYGNPAKEHGSVNRAGEIVEKCLLKL